MCADTRSTVTLLLLFIGEVCCGSELSCTSVTLPPRFLPPPSWALLECTLVASHSFTVEWSTPSGLTVVSPNNSTNRLHTFQSKKTNNTTKLALNVTGLSYQDEGRYDCIVETLSTTLQAGAQLELLTLLSTSLALSNGVAEMSCGMSGYLPPDEQLLWFKADTQVVSSGRLDISFHPGISETTSRLSVLRIEPLTALDNGLYTCRLSDRSVTSQQVSLDTGTTLDINPTMASPDTLLVILLPVLAVALLIILLTACIIIILLVRWRLKNNDNKQVCTSPNVSYGVHPPNVTVLEDPLYESIRNGQVYEVACPPDDLTYEYYVNEGLGPD